MAYGLRQFLAGAAMSPADLASVAPESASHIAGGPDRGPGASPKAVPGPAIVVIDTSVDDYETLLAGVDNTAEVILLGADQGLADIAAALDGRSDIASLAILSHGTAGQVVLGADSLNQETLADHNGALTAIGARMAAGGDILLYGCHVGAGASGLAFLDALAAVTGADVAASASPTGAAALGGDWRLEVTVGHIESAAAISATAQAAFPGILTAPLFTGLDGTPSFTENGSPVTLDSNVTVSDADLDALGGGNGDYAGAVLTIARVGGANTDDSFGFDTVGGSFSVSGSNLQSGGQTFATFSVTAGTLTIDFTSSGTTASTALANDVLQHIQYQNTSDAPDASAPLDWNFTDAATAGTAVTTITGSTTVTINAVNDDPTNTGSLPTGLSLLEEGTATIDLSSVVVSDVDAGTGSVGLLLSVANGGTITAATSGGVTVANPSSGWYTFTGTVSDLNSYLHNPVNAITYTGAYNVSGTASDTIYLALFDNGNTGTGGGTNVNIGSLAVDITDVNDMPTLNAARTPRSYAMVEGTSAHTIWGTRTGPTSASTVEAGQTISGFSFKVVGVQDGVDEQLTVDGTSIGLADGVSGTTSTNNLTYAVTVSGTTTTVTFTNGALSTSAFINDIKATASYSHAGDNWTSGSRTITIGTFTDSGGTTNGGVDTLVYDSGNAVINVTGVNDAPTLTATGANPTEIVGSAATLFTGAAASTIETGQTLTGFTLTVSNLTDGANEILGLDGSSVTLTDGTTGTSATNGLSYSVSVITGTATVTVTGGAVSEADFQTLINSLSYNNTATSPTTGSNRVVTLTSVTDSGGITNGGIDTSSLSLTSTITVALHNTAATFGGALTGSLSEDTSTLGGAATVTDPDAGQSSFTADTIAGSYGSLTIASNGDWVYDLNETLSGVQSLAAGDTLGDTFTVSSADGTTQDIVFTINGVNDAAVIGGTATGSIGEDSTGTATGTLTVSDIDTGQSSFTADSIAGSYGTLTIASNGDWSYDLDETLSGVQSLAAGDTLGDTITVASADGTTQDIVVTINGANDAAVIGGTSTGSIGEDSTGTATGTLTVSDIDTGQSNFTADTIAGSYGSLTIASNGDWVYDLNETLSGVQSLAAGDTLGDTITVSSADGTTQDIVVTINGANDAAVIGGTSTGSIGEDSTGTATGSLTVSDVDTGQNSFTADTVAGSYGSLTMASNGDWSYDLNETLSGVQSLAAGDTLGDTITVASVDGTTQDIVVTINGANDAAVIGGTATGSIGEDSTGTATGSLTVSDVDTGENSFTADTIPGSYGTLTMASNGDWSYDLDETLSGVQSLAAGDTLGDTITVSSADGTTQDIVVTINGANDAAVIGGTSTGSIGEDSTGTATGTLTVSDVDTGQSSFTADTITGSYGTLTMASNGDWSYDLNETLAGVQSLAAGDTLGDTITVASVDGTTQDIVVTINGANDAPTAPVLSSSGVSEHSAGAFVGTLSATDPESSAVHFSVTDDRFRVEGDQLWLKDGVSLDYGKVASLTLQVFAADTSGLSSSTQVHISVLNVGEGAAETGTNGNDTLMGTGGSDTITGGAGNDTLDGGAGNDIIIKPASDQGQDTIVGGSGGDKIEAGGGSDFVVGGGASDGATRQTLVENSDPNVDGSDTIIGGTGDDTLLGGGWNDSLINDNGRYDEGEEVEAGTSQNRLWAGAGNDVAVGSGGNDVIGGNADNDYLKGLGGNDTLYGNSGDDTLKGGNGDDLLYNGQGNDSVEGGNGNDTLWAGAGNDTLIGGDGADSFVFGHHAGDDVITDFDMSQDSLDLHLRGITSAAALTDSASAATISGQAGLLIDLGNGESVFLVGLSIGDIEGINLVGA